MKKPGRNAACPCGSGKKYKKCCEPKDIRQSTSPIAHGIEVRTFNNNLDPIYTAHHETDSSFATDDGDGD